MASGQPAEEPHDTSPPSRLERRKARTRSALIQAAQTLIADSRPEVSIQEITELADVGFGSFYNHFASKVELFRAATEATLEAHIALLNTLTRGLADPAEVFALSFRLTGRLQRVHPELMRVLVESGPEYLFSDKGLAPEARRDIRAATDHGRFDVDDIDVALACAGGALLGLLQLLHERPDLDAGQVTDATTIRVLRMLGLTRRQAAALVTRPLPPIPPA